ncbi:MAG: rhomboid family intramembrane serine protease [Longimicrobiales bacterium]
MAYRGSFGFGYGLTPWVQRLLIANTIVFLIQFARPGVTDWLAFVPGAILTRPWTVVTYMFAHGSFMHILFNMLGLFFFGPPLEARWGSREFIKFYFLCGFGGAILSFLFVNSAIIGASAAVYGVMLGFAMNWPDVPIYIWGIFPIPAKILVGIMAAFSLFSAFSGPYDGVAHFAHLGGFVAAFIYMKWDRRGRSRSASKLRNLMTKRKLTVVPGDGKSEGPTAGVGATRSRETPDDRALLDQIDRVLDKISEKGIASLTAEERRLLDEVSRRRRQN